MVRMTELGKRLTDEERDELARYEPLVRGVARMAMNRNRLLDPDETESDAAWGAIQAIRTYDPKKGASIATHIRTRARYAIVDGLRVRNATRKCEDAKAVANPVKCDFSECQHPDQTDTGKLKHDALIPRVEPDTSVDELDSVMHMIRKIATNDEQEAVLVLRFVHGFTMKEIGQSVGACESRISQLLSELMARAKAVITHPSERNH